MKWVSSHTTPVNHPGILRCDCRCIHHSPDTFPRCHCGLQSCCSEQVQARLQPGTALRRSTLLPWRNKIRSPSLRATGCTVLSSRRRYAMCFSLHRITAERRENQARYRNWHALRQCLARLYNLKRAGNAIHWRMVSSMPKSTILLVKCVNCGVTFSINNTECMKDFRKTHKIDAMKKRILELNKRGKQ
jgi:hypothetical protein